MSYLRFPWGSMGDNHFNWMLEHFNVDVRHFFDLQVIESAASHDQHCELQQGRSEPTATLESDDRTRKDLIFPLVVAQAPMLQV